MFTEVFTRHSVYFYKRNKRELYFVFSFKIEVRRLRPLGCALRYKYILNLGFGFGRNHFFIILIMALRNDDLWFGRFRNERSNTLIR